MPKDKFISIMMFYIILSFFLTDIIAQPDIVRRQKYLEETISIMDRRAYKNRYNSAITVQDSTWWDWQSRTGELPPDFDRLSSVPFLPEPLMISEGGKEVAITTFEQWRKKRELIKKEFQQWVSGTVPPAPESFETTIISDKFETGTRLQMIEIRFGPGNKARMTFELMIPEGEGPFPVFMTQWNHRSWAQLAVRRGYIGCVYAAADTKDDTQDYMSVYPEYDFSRLMRRAWGASRVVDYLYSREEVNKSQIALSGHSRNGKQTIWAAAFDERISAAIPSSCGTGGITPWRYSDPQYCNETLDAICTTFPDWFHPRLRFFAGREDKLPVEQNLLISLIAPRIFLVHYSVMEREHNPWANEQCFNSVKKVYSFLGAEDNAGIFPRFGEHGLSSRDIERCIDFLDIRFNRKNIPWENKFYFDYTYSSWSENHKSDSLEAGKLKPVNLKEKYNDLREYEVTKIRILDNLGWLLGKEPSYVKPDRITRVREGDWMDNITGRPKVEGASGIHLGPYNAIGDHLRGILYVPVDPSGNNITKSGGKIPVVIFLHQYSYAHGFAVGYTQAGGQGNALLFKTLIDKGFAVFAMDMPGFGTRLEEGMYFYRRFPEWSKMGNMVHDVKSCVDGLMTFDFIDSTNIYILGNTIGGSVGLMAAALDNRIAGVAAVAAFSPWRSSNSQVESIRTYSDLHGFIPKLGLFANEPQNVPVDFAEIISCIAPRPLMIIAPTLDRYTIPQAVGNTMKKIKGVYELYGKPESLIFNTPLEINRMTEKMNAEVAEFFKGIRES